MLDIAYPNSSGLQRGGQEEDSPGSQGAIDWREYEPAIRRWERITGRVVPHPTEVGPKGNVRLSAAFVEWMMGLPRGHVTEVFTARKDLFRLLGNGVVPQQAALAIDGLINE